MLKRAHKLMRLCAVSTALHSLCNHVDVTFSETSLHHPSIIVHDDASSALDRNAGLEALGHAALDPYPREGIFQQTPRVRNVNTISSC